MRREASTASTSKVDDNNRSKRSHRRQGKPFKQNTHAGSSRENDVTSQDPSQNSFPSPSNDNEGSDSMQMGALDVSSSSTIKSSHADNSSGSQDEQSSIMRRLNVLSLLPSGIELSEQQRSLNLQDQEDEVLAVQAIFEDDFVVLEGNEAGDQMYMVLIHVEVPNALNVFVEMVAADSGQLSTGILNKGIRMGADPVNIRVHAFTLKYLPPLKLIYRLPASYPSHSPPTFVLSANWLSGNQLSKLCNGLDALWEEQVGDVVIYRWTEWLRDCLSHLKIINELDLKTASECNNYDKRAFSGCSSSDDLISRLVQYNEERKNDNFLRSLQTCCICFTEQLGKEFIWLPCTHFFCYGCMKQFTSLNVKEGTVKNMNCPDTTCKRSIPPAILKKLLEHDEFERWETLLLQKTLDSMADVVYCPRCETLCIEDTDHFAQCTICFYTFCSLCRGPRHIGQECMSPEQRLSILEGRQKGFKSGEEQRRIEQNYVNELLNLKFMRETAKQCPSCKMAITKTEGCNKVTCGNCGQYFCFKCNKAIEGYDHFRGGGCILFDDEEIQRWELVMNAIRAPAQPEGAGGRLLWHICPNCGQRNLKEGNNNHILCWSCNQHFCALCRAAVRRSSEHYGSGPNKCKQHTAD